MFHPSICTHCVGDFLKKKFKRQKIRREYQKKWTSACRKVCEERQRDRYEGRFSRILCQGSGRRRNWEVKSTKEQRQHVCSLYSSCGVREVAGWRAMWTASACLLWSKAHTLYEAWLPCFIFDKMPRFSLCRMRMFNSLEQVISILQWSGKGRRHVVAFFLPVLWTRGRHSSRFTYTGFFFLWVFPWGEIVAALCYAETY